MFLIVAWTLAGIVLLIASVHDLRTREVPDWLSYAFFAAAAGVRLIAALVWHDTSYLVEGAFGLVLAAAIAALMYYAGQWGGGDSKLILGVGLLFGLRLSWDTALVSYLVNFLLCGAAYGLVWSGALAIKHRKEFSKEMALRTKKPAIKYGRWALAGLALVLGIISVVSWSEWLIPGGLLVAITFFGLEAWLFIKAIEKACMIKWYPTARLTEGDWIVKDVIVRKQKVCGPKDLGITKEQIALLKKLKVKRVLVKEGIPFVPSFLLAYLATLLFGNLLFRLL
ncbi:MAG: prepilin peptidase [Nanoarchaeota archaeon]